MTVVLMSLFSRHYNSAAKEISLYPKDFGNSKRAQTCPDVDKVSLLTPQSTLPSRFSFFPVSQVLLSARRPCISNIMLQLSQEL